VLYMHYVVIFLLESIAQRGLNGVCGPMDRLEARLYIGSRY